MSPMSAPDRSRPAAAGDAIELWFADLSAASVALMAFDRAHDVLPEVEREALRVAAGGTDVAHRLLARIALRLCLWRRFGADIARHPFEPGPGGKPRIAGLAGDFNLAHSGGCALIGVGSVVALGVDLERSRALHLSAARQAALVEAADGLATDPLAGDPLAGEGPARVLQAWARLEALAKADGTGIGRTLKRLGAWGPGRVPAAGARAAPEVSLEIFDLPVAAPFYAAVALPAGTRRPPLQRLPEDEAGLSGLVGGAPLGANSGVDLSPLPPHKGPRRSVAQPG